MRPDFHKYWKKVPGFIRNDFIRKLLSLILAGIVYIAVLDRLSSNHEIPDVQVTLSPPPGFVIMEDARQTVRITVKGSGSILKGLRPKDFSVMNLEINPERYFPGKPYILPVTPENIRAPLGVTVSSVTPEYLSVDIDKLKTKELAVIPVYDSQSPLPAGYAVEKVTVSPQLVRVTAPSVILDKLTVLNTEPIRLERITQNFDINSEVVAPRPDIKISPAKVVIQFEIGRDIETKRFPGLPIRILKGDDNDRSNVEILDRVPVEVVVSAPREQLEKLAPEQIKVYVDVSGFGRTGVQEVPVGCWVTDNGVTVRSVTPQTVKVKITR